MPATITVRNTLDWAMTKPSLTKVLGSPITGLGGTAVPIKIANKVLQEILQEPFAWKWNRRQPAAFLTNQLQQDYSTSITDCAWLEDAERIEIMNPQFVPPSPPLYPIRGVEAVRELMPVSVQGVATQICQLPNSEAICGTWTAGATFSAPNATIQMPIQGLLQIRDSNGNIQVLTGYGTCGTVQPTWATAANATTTDGSCQWTMADPNGITWRLSPCPQQSGTPYSIQPYYQKKPTTITTVGALWTVPDELSGLYEQGFIAYAWDAAEEDQKFQQAYALFQMRIKKSLVSNDREQESYGMFPGRSLTGVVGNLTRGDQQYPPGLFSN